MCDEYAIYKHVVPNGKVYIGITSKSPSRRWMNGEGYSGMFFYNAIRKYGWDNIEHVILRSGLTEEDAKIAERKLIKRYGSRDRSKGYNRSCGGDISPMKSHSARTKSSASHLGKKLSEDTKQKMSKVRTGIKKSEEQRTKISNSVSASWKNEDCIRRHKDSAPKRAVRCFTKDGVFVQEYESLKEANANTGIDFRNIQACCAGRKKTSGGFIWKYVS